MSFVLTYLSSASLAGYLRARSGALALLDRATIGGRADQRGQATAEYALVLLGVAAVALLVGAWATKTGKIGQLLDKVMDSVLGKAK